MSKTALAKEFGISRSTLYRKSIKSEKDKLLLVQVLAIMQEHPHYGKPRIALEMGRNIKLVRRIMHKYGLKAKKRRKRFRKPKDEGKRPSDIPNRIKRLSPIGPNVFWVGDFTDLEFYGRHIYLATVVDQYTREVVGWSIGLHHTAQLVIDALEHARARRGTPHIFHSDQGSEYDSLACKAWLMAHRILPSHSKKSSPWENGHQESFYGKFKEEVGSLYKFKSLDELLEGIYGYIHYYNNRRMHRSLKMTPSQKYMEAIRQNLMPQIKEKTFSKGVA